MEQQTPSWGITPVPERLRVLGLFDLTLLWGNLSVSLLVIVAAAGLVLDGWASFGRGVAAFAVGAVVTAVWSWARHRAEIRSFVAALRP